MTQQFRAYILCKQLTKIVTLNAIDARNARLMAQTLAANYGGKLTDLEYFNASII